MAGIKSKSEREKMLSGEEYHGFDGELVAMRQRTRRALRDYNSGADAAVLEELLQYKPENLTLIPPLQCDYGEHIKFGKNVFVNFNLSALSCAEIEIGDNCYIGPNVQLYTAMHPLEPERRNKAVNFARPVKIGANCWLGGGVIVLPGVEIGEGCAIGAGSVVTKNIPPRSIAVGNPCRVVRQLDEKQ